MLNFVHQPEPKVNILRHPSYLTFRINYTKSCWLAGFEVVKRWVNEAQEAVNSDSVMVQYHALGLLYHIRKTDRLAVTKLVSKLTK